MDYTGEIEVKEYFFECDGSIPNNSTPPLLVYPGVLVESDPDASRCKRLLSGNGWSGVFGLIIALSPRRLSASSSASALRSALELRDQSSALTAASARPRSVGIETPNSL